MEFALKSVNYNTYFKSSITFYPKYMRNFVAYIQKFEIIH